MARLTGRTIDPEGAEPAALRKLVDFAGLRVLEVGCGDGRLTFRYAGPTASVLATDPDESSIRRARRLRPQALRGRVRFSAKGVMDLRVPRSSFDLVFFTWSL